MRRHTRLSLLVGFLIACFGAAKLCREATRTKRRHRKIVPLLRGVRVTADDMTAREWAEEAERRTA